MGRRLYQFGDKAESVEQVEQQCHLNLAISTKTKLEDCDSKLLDEECHVQRSKRTVPANNSETLASPSSCFILPSCPSRCEACPTPSTSPATTNLAFVLLLENRKGKQRSTATQLTTKCTLEPGDKDIQVAGARHTAANKLRHHKNFKGNEQAQTWAQNHAETDRHRCCSANSSKPPGRIKSVRRGHHHQPAMRPRP